MPQVNPLPTPPGIYYPPGSLKAQTCVEGNALMYKFCEQYNVPVRRTGKLLVATSDQQLDQLESTRRSAAANGVELERLTPGEIRELEPEVQAVAGLLAPNTGIVDSHRFVGYSGEGVRKRGQGLPKRWEGVAERSYAETSSPPPVPSHH